MVAVKRAGVILSVRDVWASRDFYVGQLGFQVDTEYQDPAYVILTLAGMRLSLSGQGNQAADLPGFLQHPPKDSSNQATILVIEVGNCESEYQRLRQTGAQFASELFRPPWGGGRFFITDPDNYLIEIEELA